ncbi:hypothetical protein LEP1GSC008_2062 [Leptospira kirschneri serovar Bulgarica str. Nikolaevo]|uniref:Uncharacterized protein n=1 Tax=Leptospira kirschneri serovar Bulgarica str. Nikolaevo TaxID=1240687 RepID=M6F491_9LEPT|nr:hypothetical protein LEP1GSC008_2062 [Leptospira kirschneri serovar Bulgarica str. Nikolaevo]
MDYFYNNLTGEESPACALYDFRFILQMDSSAVSARIITF